MIDRKVDTLSQHWLAMINLAWGMFAGLAWLPPLLMEARVFWAARALYTFFPYPLSSVGRPFFLFGPKPMYSSADLQSLTPQVNAWAGMSGIIGSTDLGYKVAWSDRMVAMSVGILMGGLFFALVRRKAGPLSWQGLCLMILPMALDGSSPLGSASASSPTAPLPSIPW